MVSFSFVTKRFVLWSVFAVVFFAIAAEAHWLWQDRNFNPPLPPTLDGVFFESLLPPDTRFVLNFSPTDTAERDRFLKLWKAIFQDNSQAVVPFLLNEFFSSAAGQSVGGLGIKISPEDIVPLLNLNVRFALAKSDRSLYILFSLPENASALNFLAGTSTTAGSKFQAGTLGNTGYVVLGPQEDEDALRKRYERRDWLRPMRPESFFRQKNFREAVKDFAPPMSGYFYLDVAYLPGVLAQKSPFAFAGQKFFTATAQSFHAEENGILFSKTSLGAPEKLAQSEFRPYFAPTQIFLYQRMPSAGLLFYVEDTKLEKFFLDLSRDFYANFQTLTGLDFLADVKPLLASSYALALHDAGSLLPAITVLLDEKNANDPARALFEKLDKKIDALVALSNLSLLPQKPAGRSKAGLKTEAAKEGPVLEKQPLKSPFDGFRLTFYTQRIDKTIADIPLFQLLDKPITLTYGFTPDHVFFFSTFPDFEKAFTENSPSSLAGSPLFQQTLAVVPDPGDLLLVDGTSLGAYLQRLEKFEPSTFDLFKKYLLPIQSYVQAGQADGKNVHGKAFLKVKL